MPRKLTPDEAMDWNRYQKVPEGFRVENGRLVYAGEIGLEDTDDESMLDVFKELLSMSPITKKQELEFLRRFHGAFERFNSQSER